MNEIEKILEELRQETAKQMNNIFPKTLAMNHFDLPFVVEKDDDYFEALKGELDKYMKYVKTIKKLPESVLKNIEENVKLVLNSLNFFYMGYTVKGVESISRLLEKYKENEFLISDIDKSYALRGMSYFDTKWDMTDEKFNKIKTNELSFFKARTLRGRDEFTREEMLHIPFDKRELVSSMRYSIIGTPCMYLGVSSYTCWVELGRPKLDDIAVSSYKLPKNLKILNLALGEGLINGTSTRCHMTGKERDSNLLSTLLEVWPLLCAASGSVKQEGRTFKSEYIVPQFIMMSLKTIGVQGVAYCSNKVEYSSYRFPNCINIAIPAYMYLNEEFAMDKSYGIKALKTELTEPMRAMDILKSDTPHSKKSYYNECFYDRDKQYVKLKIGEDHPYTYEDFYNLDNKLVSMDHRRAFSGEVDIEDENK